MSKHEGCTRRFAILSQAWHANANLTPEQRRNGEDEITIGLYLPDGSSSGEFRIQWKPCVNRVAPTLRAWEDSWSALANFSDVIQKLGELDSTNPSVQSVAEVLKSCGVTDNTPREHA
jgi:hypothetical protein